MTNTEQKIGDVFKLGYAETRKRGVNGSQTLAYADTFFFFGSFGYFFISFDSKHTDKFLHKNTFTLILAFFFSLTIVFYHKKI